MLRRQFLQLLGISPVATILPKTEQKKTTQKTNEELLMTLAYYKTKSRVTEWIIDERKKGVILC